MEHACRALNGEIFVLAPRAARNLAFQDKLPTSGKAELLLALKGQDLIGVPLSVGSLDRRRALLSCTCR